MLSTKIRTAVVAIVAATGLATALPAVSQARPIIKTAPKVTCPDIDGQGLGSPGEQRTISWNAIQPNGTFKVESETKICGSDGKWHTVLALVVTPMPVVDPAPAVYLG